MKTLLVNPCLRPDAPHRYLPVGLGYVATAVKEAGIPFDLLDIDINVMSDEAVESYITRNRYDVIALGAIVTHYRWVRDFIHMVKRIQPHCLVVVGNSVGSSIPEVLFQTAPVDVVILGEADATIVDVLHAFEKGQSLGAIRTPLEEVTHTNGEFPACHAGDGIPGIVFRADDGMIVHTGRRKAIKPIDDLPYPDWDLFDVERYFGQQKGFTHQTSFYPADQIRAMPLNTARGCVFKCTFCHHVFWHDPYRRRSPESVIGEMRRNQKKWGANYIEFWDELTFHKWKPAEAFVDALLEADLGIHWTAAIRADLLGKKKVPEEDRLRVAEKFVRSGCVALGFSLESGSNMILQDMNKHMKSEHFTEQVRLLRKVGLVSDTSVVVGYPRETKETIAETMEMCCQARVYPSVGFLLPLPETGMWAHAMEHNHIPDVEKFLLEVTERQDVVLNMTTMSDDELLGETTGWLKQLNQSFGSHLDEESLIKTKGYGQHNQHQDDENDDLPPEAIGQSLNMALKVG
ncbi:MAG: B12-binding domain-containing radical SAM protein [Magnetococcales bacterium]|nr:B12-binding domain-containing radical SAM protein [Magnetococcales bacterium]